MKHLMWLPFLVANVKIYILQYALQERKFQTLTTNWKIRIFKVVHSVHFLPNLFYFIKPAKCTHNTHNLTVLVTLWHVLVCQTVNKALWLCAMCVCVFGCFSKRKLCVNNKSYIGLLASGIWYHAQGHNIYDPYCWTHLVILLIT
jgi:hypothetical protein